MRFLSALSLAVAVTLTPVITYADEGAGLSPVEQLAQAEDLRDQNRWDEAIALLQEVVGRAQEDAVSAATAQIRLGQYRLAMAMPAEAEQELRKVAQNFPGQIELVGGSRVYLIDALAFQGRTADAIAAAQALAADGAMPAKHQAWGFVKLAGLLREQGQLQQALTELEALDTIAWAPDTVTQKAQAGLTRGEILMSQGNRSGAATVLQEVITQSGDAVPETVNWSRVRLLEALTHSRSLDQTAAVADAVVADHGAGRASDAQVSWALLWRGRALIKARQFGPADEALQMAASVATNKLPEIAHQAEFELGEAARRADDHEAALAYYYAAFERARDAELSDDKLDWCRLQIGAELRHLGMRDRGIAWLRMGVQDPANLTNTDRVLIERLTSFLDPTEREDWHAYLLDPAGQLDPTAAFVQQEFAEAPPGPSEAFANNAFVRQYWLGRFYDSQERYEESVSAYLEAYGVARTAQEYGQALSDLSWAQLNWAVQLRRAGLQEDAADAIDDSLQNAHQAVEYLIQLIHAGSTGEAHSANQTAVRLYAIIQQPELAMATANRIVNELGPDAPPSKLAFAYYMRMQGFFWTDDYAGAVQAAMDLDQQFSGYPDADIRHICGAALSRASAYYVWLGDPATGLSLLDEVERRYPGEHTEWNQPYREFCQRKLAELQQQE